MTEMIHPLAGLPQFEDVVAAGLGATARVFRARHVPTGRWVAVKVFVRAGDAGEIGRYERELAITGLLCEHPCIVSLLEHGVTPGGCPYLVMPWYDRGSLAAELGRAGPMPVVGVLTLGVRIAAALDRAHAAGVCHRDVKPANILLPEHGLSGDGESRDGLAGAGESVLADFGESGGTASFTPGHAAPEVLRHGVADERSDVWSLASTLYTALAGHRPFAGSPGSEGSGFGSRGCGSPGPGGLGSAVGGCAGTGGDLSGELVRTMRDPLPPLTRPDVPPPLARLLARALAKRPADRPTARELAIALQHLQVDGGHPVTRIPGPAEPSGDLSAPALPVATADGEPPTVVRMVPVTPPPGRRPLVTAVFTALATLVLATGGVLVSARWPEPDRSLPARASASVTAARSARPPIAAARSGRPVIEAAVGGLRVVSRSATVVELAWQDPNDGRVRYFVLVDPDRRDVGPVPAATATGLTVTGLRPGTGYCFRVVTGVADVAPVTPPVCARTR